MPGASSPATASGSRPTCSPTAPPTWRKTPPAGAAERVKRFRVLIGQERDQPYRLADLAVDGTDLIDLGFSEGPQLGQVLQTLLDEVVEDPRATSASNSCAEHGSWRDPLGAAWLLGRLLHP